MVQDYCCMSRDSILDELVKSGFIEWYTLQLMSKTSGFIVQTDEEYQEYIQEIWLQICEIQDDKLIDLYNENKLKAYVSGLIHRNVKSNTSPAYTHIRKQNNKYIRKSDDDWEKYSDTNDISYLNNDNKKHTE